MPQTGQNTTGWGVFADITEDRAFTIGLVLILIGAAAIRFWQIGVAPFWMDEATSVALAELPLNVILFNGIDNHPPLHFALQNLWQQVFPDHSLARVPAALLGLGSLATVMLMMRDQVSVRAALIAGLILTLNTAHIFYSQEARMYTLLVLGMALAAWGALGQANPGRHSQRTYTALYVIGGAIAIYSHTIGLVAMFCVGMGGLGGGLITGRGMAFAWDWFKRNLILLVISLPWLIQLPASMGFGGLIEPADLFSTIWYFKTVTAYPGVGDWENLLAPVLYALVAWGVLWAWLNERRALAVMLVALAALYPAMIYLISLDRPLVSVRTMMPTALGIALAAGVGFDRLRWRWAANAMIAVVLGASLWSSLYQAAHPMKAENIPEGYRIAAEAGYAGAPVLTCYDMHATNVYFSRPSGEHFLQMEDNGVLRFTPDYWNVARHSKAVYLRATSEELDALYGGGLLVPGGFGEALRGEDQVIFFHTGCISETYDLTRANLAKHGFVNELDMVIREGSPEIEIITPPFGRIALYRRSADGTEGETP